MFLGYNTNGFSYHRLEDAIAILDEFGYRGIAITLDYHHLNPFAADVFSQARYLAAEIRRRGMTAVIETGARYLLDPRRKHQPTLVSRDDQARIIRRQFLERAIRLAPALGAEVVSFWSGSPDDDTSFPSGCPRLIAELEGLLPIAQTEGVCLALEPEPGMLIQTTVEAVTVVEHFGNPHLGLTIDVGHIHCLCETSMRESLLLAKPYLRNIHLEDMRAGVHDHLMFGEGEINFRELFEVLREIGYREGLYVELSRHAHEAVRIALEASSFLKPFLATIHE
jgi:sugar phosphate isomerase/epimerase